MKKSLLALAVLGAFAGAAQAQSSVTIYGIVDTGITFTNAISTGSDTPGGTSITWNNTVDNPGTSNRFDMESGILQGSRLGFKGVEDLGGGLSAVFNLEAGFQADAGSLDEAGNLFRRKSVVGLSGGFGTVLLGRQTDGLDDIGTLTSVADFGSQTGAVGHNLNRLEGTRSINSIRYNTADLGGFVGTLIYGLGEQAGQRSAGQSFGASGLYTNGPLGLGAGYYQSKAGINPSDTFQTSSTGTDTVLKTFTLAASYQLGAARLYGNWSRVKQPMAVGADGNTVIATEINGQGWGYKAYSIGGTNNDKTDIFELGASYALSPSLKLLGSVQQSRINYVASTDPTVGQAMNATLGLKGRLTQFNLGADYSLSKRTDLYAFVSNLRAKKTGNPGISGNANGDAAGYGANQVSASVGIRHKF